MNNTYITLFIKYYKKNITVFQLLIRVFHINKSLAFFICNEIGINPFLNLYYFNKVNFNFLIEKLEFYLEIIFASKNIVGKEEIHLQQLNYLKNLQETKNIKYFRLKNGLPIHGQRTHSNGHVAKLKLHFYE